MSYDSVFEEKELKEIAIFKNGKTSPEREDSHYFPVYGSNGIIGYSSEFNSDENSVIIGRVGSYCGSVYFSKEKSWVTDNAIIGKSKGKNDPSFLYYLLKRINLNDLSSGSGQPLINQKLLYSIKVPVPNFNEQKEIGKFLSDIDKKIQINQKMNQTMEEIGQAIFKHWFVHFEFPNEEGKPYKSSGGEMVDSELGKIPKSWEVGTLNDLCDSITNGGTPKRKEEKYWDNGNIPWYKTGELSDDPLIDSEEHITPEGLNNSSCKLWEPNTILIALYASPTVGRLGILKTNATSNQACSGLVAKKEIGYQYLFYNLLFKREELNSIAVGSAQQNISQDIVKNTKTIIPPSNLTLEFQNIIEPFFEKKTLLLEESSNLSQIRDSILPKLMSGKIRVI